ncbi:hypothetical protein [Fictibacillus enclensis]|uniref:hypothetical protein n=1 Tax=Fictibacillus enclensis TaxID=1017270 RepID=UPI0024BF7BE2|nr:hypothetical protein [Fictibacillus enclensis]WHY71030.1 hypothetical protein QNH15_18640 [Fictibacillus enclensis]
MINYLTRIGEHIIQLNTSSFHLAQRIKNMFFPIPGLERRENSISITIHDGYGVPFQDYEVQPLIEGGTISFQRADYQIAIDEQFNSATIHIHDDLALKHAMMNLYSAYIVYQGWGLLLHSSCVIENNEGHIFSGHSGAGKSTAARLSYPRELLSDEATIVKIDREGHTVFDSPFRSEMEERARTAFVPLSSIQLLYQSKTNKRIKIKSSDALISMMDKVFYWNYSVSETKKVLRLLTALVSEIPVHQLYFQKNNTFWELIS